MADRGAAVLPRAADGYACRSVLASGDFGRNGLHTVSARGSALASKLQEVATIPQHQSKTRGKSSLQRNDSAVRMQAGRSSESLTEEGAQGAVNGYSGRNSTTSYVSKGASSTASMDKIEEQAKASIEKLKHILYKLKTRSAEANSTSITSTSTIVDDRETSSTTTRLTEDKRDMYLSQKIEVDIRGMNHVEKGGQIINILPENEVELVERELDEELHQETQLQYDSLTCTRTMVEIDEENQTAVVTITATVRGADVTDQNLYTDMTVAMAARALARTCLSFDEEAQAALRNASPMPMAEVFLSGGQQLHHRLLEHLKNSSVVSFSPCSLGSTPFRQCYSVSLLGSQGAQLDAIFKPFTPGDSLGRWKRAPADWVAYKVGLLLGFDMVPPAVIRRDITLGQETSDLGVLTAKVNDLQPLSNIPSQAWDDAIPAAVVSNGHILDALLGNAPRHASNFKAGMHWEQKGKLRPVLVDHPMGPMQGELHAMWARRGQSEGGVQYVSPSTLLKLRQLNRAALLESLSGGLNAEELELILAKRDQVVSYFDSIAQWQGRFLAAA
eukprot:SM000019S05055  [mRNA]  locus=s19:705599:708715:+ [translate_table: standard]